ncbi:hypothetical protein GW915_08310 [bacterium]|nr:hypothetical protein [bacterium]
MLIFFALCANPPLATAQLELKSHLQFKEPSNSMSDCPSHIDAVADGVFLSLLEAQQASPLSKQQQIIEQAQTRYGEATLSYAFHFLTSDNIPETAQKDAEALCRRITLKPDMLNDSQLSEKLSRTLALRAQAQNAMFSSPWKIYPEDRSFSPVESESAKTPVAAQFDARSVSDSKGNPLNIYHASDLLKWPGAPDSTKVRFIKNPFPEKSPYNQSWNYDRSFRLDKAPEESERVWLDLEELSYRADIEVNGHKVNSSPLIGPYRRHKIDITKYAKQGENKIQIQVKPPDIGALGRTWLDWHASPPDKMMGLSQEPVISVAKAQQIGSIGTNTKLASDGSAQLSLDLEVISADKKKVKEGKFLVNFNGQSKLVDISTLESRFDESTGNTFFKITPENLSHLSVANPKLWWPTGMGNPDLYPLEVSYLNAQEEITSHKSSKVGLRDVKSSLDKNGNRKFTINGEDLRIVGAGWSSDFTLNESLNEKQKKLRLLKGAGYNTIRQEGTMENSDFYNMADEMGIMVMAGWPCCTQWEASPDGKMWGKVNPNWVWNKEKYQVAESSLKDQLLKLREHPSFISWFNGSDYAPHEELEKKYKTVYSDVLGEGWSNQVIPRASTSRDSRKSAVFGPSGSEMKGPYEHVPANYWTDSKSPGHAKGFHSEIGPGISFPSLEALQELSPNLDPNGKLFNNCTDAKLMDQNLVNHAGTSVFGDMKFFYMAICEKFGEPKNTREFVRLAQLLNYEDHRAMNEAFAKNKNSGANGHIHWMGMNAWKSLRWNLMFNGTLETGGAMHGASKGNESVHPMYSYEDGSILVTNNNREATEDLQLNYRVYSPDSKLLKEVNVPLGTIKASSNLDTGKKIDLSALGLDADAALLDLRLTTPSGKLVSANSYFLPKGKNKINHAESTWYRTSADNASMKSVKEMDSNPAQVVASRPGSSAGSYYVTASNPSNEKVSFANMIKGRDSSGEYVAQSWEDNMITLRPGETREVKVDFLDTVHSPKFSISH